MDINENTDIKNEKNEFYLDFEKQQFILNFEDQAEKVVIQAFDKDGVKVFDKEFSPKFINNHLNILWQDKGVKSELPEWEWVKKV